MRMKRRTISLLLMWTIRVAIIATLFGVYYAYYRTNVFTITSYDIVGTDEESAGMIRVQLAALAQGKHYLVLPNDKIFTYYNSGIISVVRANVPDMKTISMRPVGLHTVRIDLTLLTPLVKTLEGQAITEDGILFPTKKNLDTYPVLTLASSSKETIKIEGLPFTQLTLAGDDINASFLQNLLSMSSKVSSVIFPVASILVEGTGDVTLTNASGTSKVMFLVSSDTKKVWSTLVSAIDTEPLKGKLATNRDRLLYLDVRYGNKVFYRFNDMTFQNNGTTAILDHHATTTEATTTPR